METFWQNVRLVIWIEARVDPQQAQEALYHETGADQQHD